jgi:hypothetical protein
MSFARNNYDKCAYESAIKQSTGPCSYMVGEPRPCAPCFVSDPYIRSSRFGGAICEDKELIDVDSELMGLNYKKTKCPEKEFQASDKGWCKLKNSRDCDTDNFLGAEPTRISNGPCTLRGTGWNRWDWLPCPETNHTIQLPPFERLNNTKIMAKDQHRACIPKLIDPTSLLPKYTDDGTKTQPYKYNNPIPKFVEFNNLRTCEELNRL